MDLAHEGDRVGDVLEQVLEHDAVEAGVGERQRLVDVAELDLRALARRAAATASGEPSMPV